MKRCSWLLLVLVLVACASQGEDPVSIAPAPTETLVPSNALSPTSTSIPTDTVVLPTPTPTRAPTSTPAFDPGTISINEIDGASMAYVPPGEFMMGSEEGKFDEKPAHLVYTEGFWMYQYEVTNTQYLLCMAAGVCKEPFIAEYIYESQYANFPVMYVTINSAINYCEWAGGRLPTEAEWEKAARGGLEGMDYPWGNQAPVCTFGAANGAHFDDCEDQYGGLTVPVGSFAPNGYGLYDMAGNVKEIVNDLYQEDYYTKQVYDNPQGPTMGNRIARGGGHLNLAEDVSVFFRWWTLAYQEVHALGLRCVVIP